MTTRWAAGVGMVGYLHGDESDEGRGMGGLPAGSSLMPPPRMFVNRALERDAFDREVAAVRAGGEQGVFVFTGLPGVGKTSLALWCAGRLKPISTWPSRCRWVRRRRCCRSRTH